VSQRRRRLDLIPLTVGYVTMSQGYFLEGATNTVTAPVTSFPLVHPRRLAVFDTGLDAHFCRPDGAPFIGGADLEECTKIDARIRSPGYDQRRRDDHQLAPPH